MAFNPFAQPRKHKPLDRRGICSACEQPFFKEAANTKTCSDACLKNLRRQQALQNPRFLKKAVRDV